MYCLLVRSGVLCRVYCQLILTRSRTCFYDFGPTGQASTASQASQVEAPGVRGQVPDHLQVSHQRTGRGGHHVHQECIRDGDEVVRRYVVIMEFPLDVE